MAVLEGYLLPVKAIQRAYLVASRRQCEATSSPQVTVREMMPMMMKKSVVTHSGGSRGGMQVRSRPWIVWHCRTSPTVRAPEEREERGEERGGKKGQGLRGRQKQKGNKTHKTHTIIIAIKTSIYS